MTYLICTEKTKEVFVGNFSDAKIFADTLLKAEKPTFVTIGEDENHTICYKKYDSIRESYSPWETVRINTSY